MVTDITSRFLRLLPLTLPALLSFADSSTLELSIAPAVLRSLPTLDSSTPLTISNKKELIPATDADTEHLRYFLRAMPFAGDTFAPHCRAVAYEALPPVNARGGRDCEGWTCVYEAVVQDSEYLESARSSTPRVVLSFGWVSAGHGLGTIERAESAPRRVSAPSQKGPDRRSAAALSAGQEC